MMKALSREIDQIRMETGPVELLMSHRYLREVNFQDNMLKNIQSKEVSGKAVRVIHNGRVGVAPGGLQTPVEWLVSTARKLSRLGREAAFSLPDGSGKLQSVFHEDPMVPDIDQRLARELAETLIARVEKALPEWVVNGSVTLATAVNRLVTSRGIDQRFEERCAGFYVHITLPREGDLLELIVSRHRFPDADLMDQLIDDLVQRARQAETVTEMPPGEYPLLLHPEALSSILTAFEIAVKGQAVYEGLSPLKDKIGQPIFNPMMTIVDDPTDPELSGYTPLADEGCPTQARVLVENGVLKSYLTDLDYAARLNQPHTGHGARFPGSLDEATPSGEASIAGSSWVLSPGSTPLADLMNGITDGIYLMATWDVWSGNVIGGDISGSTHLAYRIQNGKPVGRIKDMRVSGNIYSMLGEKLAAMSAERPETSAGDLRAPYMLIDGVTLA